MAGGGVNFAAVRLNADGTPFTSRAGYQTMTSNGTLRFADVAWRGQLPAAFALDSYSLVFVAENVGLLTGDNTINGEAPIVVMTTEVLRNMLYTGSLALSGLGYVVLDEVHYLQDPVAERLVSYTGRAELAAAFSGQPGAGH